MLRAPGFGPIIQYQRGLENNAGGTGMTPLERVRARIREYEMVELFQRTPQRSEVNN